MSPGRLWGDKMRDKKEGSLWFRATQRGNIKAFDCTKTDRAILRELAKHITELAAGPENTEKRKLWIAHGSMEDTRPLVICDPENGWNEILNLECESESARTWEFLLRKKLFWLEEMGDDTPVEASLEIPYTYQESEWVAGGARETISASGGHSWAAMMTEDMTMEALETPRLTVDIPRSRQVADYAREILADTISVHLRGKWWHSLGLTNSLGEIRGFEQVYYDMYDEPELVLGIMEKICAYNEWKLDYLEANGLLTLNNDMLDVPAGILGYTRDLPQEREQPLLSGLWGWLEAQELAEISPQMFEEFVFPFQQRIARRFGLVSYGCCEKMQQRFEKVRTLPNLRRVSVSPWADKLELGEMMGGDYLYAWKLNPSVLARDKASTDAIRADIEPFIGPLRGFGCRLELVMKDNHTLCRNSQNVKTWVCTAKEIVNQL